MKNLRLILTATLIFLTSTSTAVINCFNSWNNTGDEYDSFNYSGPDHHPLHQIIMDGDNIEEFAEVASRVGDKTITAQKYEEKNYIGTATSIAQIGRVYYEKKYRYDAILNLPSMAVHYNRTNILAYLVDNMAALGYIPEDFLDACARAKSKKISRKEIYDYLKMNKEIVEAYRTEMPFEL